MDDFEKAKDKIMMGAERRSMVMSEDEKKLTAYHEAGHAIVGRLVPEHDPVYKVTIIPRGRALGVTMFLPEQDRYSYSKRRSKPQIATLFGGRVAEELIFGPTRSPPVPRTTSSAPPRWRATWSPSGACPTNSAPLPTARRGRSVPRSFGHPAQEGVRRHRARHRRGGAPRRS
jgi:hypothetical protein